MANENAPPVRPSNRRATRILLAITTLGFLVFVGSLLFIYWVVTSVDDGEIADDSYLVVELSGVLSDSPTQPGLFSDPNAVNPNVTEIAESIRNASTDERVDGMLLQLEPLAAGWGSLQEIRTALDVFRASGKPCVAYAEMYDDTSYYLASACDRVALAPSGITMVNGMASSYTYYAEAFEALGIEPEFEHVGDFKSAIEVYERTGPSEEASQAMDYLLDGIYDQLVAGIASGRGLDDAAARALINTAPMSPMDAKERGLVDVLAYPDAIRANMKLVTDDGWEAALEAPVTDEVEEKLKDHFTKLDEVVKKVRANHKSKSVKIAVIHAEGPIMSGGSDGGLFGSSILGDRTFRKWMDAVRKDDDVKAVVIRVNSPGGSGLASDMMWREINRAKAEGLPVVVSMADYAASGGYYIAAPADWIVAQPGTITGSIGVFGGKFNLSGTYDKLKLHQHTYQRGELANLFSPTHGFSEEGRATYKRFLSDFYEVFLAKVTSGRPLDRDQAHAVAQGRVWTGEQALERNLVDELGGLDVALAKAAELAELEEDSWGIKRWPRKKELLEVLLEDFGGESTVNVEVDLGLPALINDEAVDALDDLVLLEAMMADGPVMLLPGAPRFD